MTDIRDLPLDQIGLDPRPERQVRPIDPEWVRHLRDETDPADWDPLTVRLWPASDPKPRGGHVQVMYQVISGYHRTTAARELGLPTLRAEVRDVASDAEFLLLAIKGNLRHGKPMSSEEQRAAVQRLRATGLSVGDIAKQTGIPKGTVQNWLAGRNTNAARSVRTRQPGGDADTLGAGGAGTGAAEPVITLDARRLAAIAGHLNKAINLGDLTALVPPGEAVAWLAAQSPATRRVLAERFTHIAAWWQMVAAAAAAASPREGRQSA